jgi:nicotinate phosphoribosyltransferase
VTGSERDDPLRSALFTDLYELTMSAAYFAEGMDRRGVFELFFRRMPPTRNFIIAAGLDEVLSYLEHLHFSADDLAYLADQDRFSREFLDFLAELRFTGDVHALPEGTPVFPDEPLIRVEAPVIEAQLVETLVLNQIHFQSIAASKAARVVIAADGRDVVDFGSRRAHGTDAALKVARTSYLAGAAGTSNVLAGKLYGVPIFGTMAHSYIQSHDDEAEALRAFAEVHPDTTLLVDTYDTLEGVRTVVELSRDDERPLRVSGIRLDSGDLGELARKSRRLLDEHTIRALVASGAPIDGFGVGTNMAVSDDAPGLDMAYKLVAYAGRPRMKLSTSKVMHPGPKQVFRSFDAGRMVHDVIARADEELAGEPLLEPVMRGGRRLAAGGISLEGARARAREQLGRLPDRLLGIEPGDLEYPVSFSPALEWTLEDLSRSLEAGRGAATTTAEHERRTR